MQVSLRHKIDNIYINERKSSCNIQNLQDDIAFMCSLPASLFDFDSKEH
jgi:hypothetical protein